MISSPAKKKKLVSRKVRTQVVRLWYTITKPFGHYFKRVLMGVPNCQLTTNFSANCQLTTIFLANCQLTTNFSYLLTFIISQR